MLFNLQKHKNSCGSSDNQKTWIQEIHEIQRQMEQAYTLFNFEQDDDLIISAVYTMQALQARYRYLLRRIKEEGDYPIMENPVASRRGRMIGEWG